MFSISDLILFFLTSADIKTTAEIAEQWLFRALDKERKGYVTRSDILDSLQVRGLRPDCDPRLKTTLWELRKYGESQPLDFQKFSSIVNSNVLLIEKAVRGQMIIPEFATFCSEIDDIYKKTQEHHTGKVATYIPQLGRVHPEYWAGMPPCCDVCSSDFVCVCLFVCLFVCMFVHRGSFRVSLNCVCVHSWLVYG